MKYKVVEATLEYLKEIEFDFNFDGYEVGDTVNMLGQILNISQIGGGVVGASNKDSVVFVQEIISS